jgi:chemotaxis protein methyltransferase CheR
MDFGSLNDNEYKIACDWLYRESGITLGAGKKALVQGRLHKRLQESGLTSYSAYFDKLRSGQWTDEAQVALNLLTTNETYFFREPAHFKKLSELASQASKDHVFRVWSAASSSGEEAYTIAMTLQELTRLGRCQHWEVRGSDLSTRVLEKAASGIYSMERTQGIPADLMKRYFLKGSGPYEGSILVDRVLREKVDFAQINLIEPLPNFDPFDVIFLRNVLIYFENDIKRKVVNQLLTRLLPGGVLFVGLAETLNGLVDGLTTIGPGAYQYK